MENIIEEYIQFVEDFLIKFYQTLLGDTYDEIIVKAFIDKYINIRYYNTTSYPKAKSFIERMAELRKKYADVFEDPTFEGLPVPEDGYDDEKYLKKLDEMWG